MGEPSTLRWLLRVLGDDAMLPIYMRAPGDGSADSLRLLETVFFSMAADDEHPDDDRKAAWGVLEPLAEGDSIAGFYDGLVRALRERLTNGHGELARFWGWPELGGEAQRKGTNGPPYSEIHAHFRGSIPFDHVWLSVLKDARVRSNLRRFDCTAGRLKYTRAELVAEAAKVRDCMDHAASHQPKTVSEPSFRLRCMRSLGHAEMQYLVLYTNLRRFMLHQRGVTGLVPFDGSYNRYRDAGRNRSRRNTDREAVVAILRRFERSEVAALELRPTLDTCRLELQRKLRTIVLGYFDYLAESTAKRPVALGLVPSLYKQEVSLKARRVHGRTHDVQLQARLRKQQHVWSRQVDVLLAILDEVPGVRQFVVGFDAAGLEQGTPVRALTTAFQKLHAYHRKWNLTQTRQGRKIPVEALRSQLAAAHVNPALAVWESLGGRRGIPSGRIARCRLGLTIHVGEDFVDPTTGLREMWEAITYLGLRRGDRIGHGIAVSLDRRRVAALVGRRAKTPAFSAARVSGAGHVSLRKPLGVHVLDLAWTSAVLGDDQGAQAEVVLAISRALGGLPMHHALRRSLAAGFPVAAMLPGVCFIDHEQLDSAHSIGIEIDSAWYVRFEQLRRVVVEKLRAHGIVIESCPTSNCAVANLDDPPLFGLLEIKPPLRCAVATDDPGVLGAWPEHELARLDAPKHAGRDYRRRVLLENARASFVR